MLSLQKMLANLMQSGRSVATIDVQTFIGDTMDGMPAFAVGANFPKL